MSAPEAPDSPFRRPSADGAPEWQRPAVAPPPVIIPEVAQPAAATELEEVPARRNRTRLLITAGTAGVLCLAVLLTAGAFVAYRFLLGHEDRVTAEYAPADSYAYAAVNTDPTSRAWLDAWGLAERLGVDDELRDLPRRMAEEQGEDPSLWETLVKRAIGHEIGIAVWPGAGDETRYACIALTGDQQKARELIAEALEDEQTTEFTYRDITFQVTSDGMAIGLVDDAIVVAGASAPVEYAIISLDSDGADPSTSSGQAQPDDTRAIDAGRAAFEAVVDARRDGALDGVTRFNDAAERAADDPLVFVYVDGPALSGVISDVAGGMPMPGIGSAFDTYTDLGAITVTLKANADSLRVTTLTEGRPEHFAATPAGQALSDQMPAETLFYAASSDMYEQVWRPVFEALGQMDDGSATSYSDDPLTMFPIDGLDDLLGIDLEADLLAHLRGQFALGVGVEPYLNDYRVEGRLLSRVDDSTAVRDAVDHLADTLEEQGVTVERTPDGFRVDEGEVHAELAVVGDTLRLTGSYGTLNVDGALADEAAFQRAMADLPADASWTGYVALRRIIDLLPVDVWTDMDPDARAALEQLESLAFGMAPDGAGTRSEVVVRFGAP